MVPTFIGRGWPVGGEADNLKLNRVSDEYPTFQLVLSGIYHASARFVNSNAHRACHVVHVRRTASLVRLSVYMGGVPGPSRFLQTSSCFSEPVNTSCNKLSMPSLGVTCNHPLRRHWGEAATDAFAHGAH